MAIKKTRRVTFYILRVISLSLSLSLSLCKYCAKPWDQGVQRDKYLRKGVHFLEIILTVQRKKNIFKMQSFFEKKFTRGRNGKNSNPFSLANLANPVSSLAT